MSVSTYKVFVGNVPFDCDDEEFSLHLKNSQIDGYIKGEIVTKFNSTLSRGFGFVTLDNETNAKKLVSRNDINFKGRSLRFTEYMMTEKQNKIYVKYENSKNYLLVSNIPSEINREKLGEVFGKITKIGKYFIFSDHQTGQTKDCGIVEILDNDDYLKLLALKNLTFNNCDFKLSSYKTNIIRKNKRVVQNDFALFNAFNAGRKIGILEGIKIKQEELLF